MSSTDPASLVGYCGLYCNACGIRQEKIKTAVNDLRDILNGYGFDKMMPELAKWEPSFKHYNEFDQVMNGLVKLFGDCSGCLQGGGDPNCKVRACAKKKSFRTCAECHEAENCEPPSSHNRLQRTYTSASEHQTKRYRKICRENAEKSGQGIQLLRRKQIASFSIPSF